MNGYKFEAVIKKISDKNGTYIEIPFDVEKEFGAKRVKVKAKFDNAEYRGSIVNMGTGCHIIGITQAIRKEIDRNHGDIITVYVEKDEEVRLVEISEEFASELNKNIQALEFFNTLSYSGKKKYCQWIDSAKKSETRKKRIDEAVMKLESKIKMK